MGLLNNKLVVQLNKMPMLKSTAKVQFVRIDDTEV